MIMNAIKNPVKAPVTKIDALGRVSTTFRGSEAAVVVNGEGKVITVYRTSR